MPALWIALLLSACAPEPTRELLDPTSWEPVDAVDDPLADQRPEGPDCSARGLVLEDSSAELRTDDCGWITLGQPSLADVAADDTLDLLFFHNALAAPDAVDPVADVRIWLAGQLIWELSVPIPHAPGLYAPELQPNVTAPAGSLLVLHVANHGENTYRLGHLQRLAR